MMLDITNRISLWVSCCSEVSDRWFKELENGEDEFLRVEEALFSSLVLSAIETVDRPSLIESYGLLTAEYRKDVDDARSVCRKQKAGNIFCENHENKSHLSCIDTDSSTTSFIRHYNIQRFKRPT